MNIKETASERGPLKFGGQADQQRQFRQAQHSEQTQDSTELIQTQVNTYNLLIMCSAYIHFIFAFFTSTPSEHTSITSF